MFMLDIGEVSDRSGLASSTLRYYEEKGLIEPVARRGLRRQYDTDIVDRLALITLGRAAGFSLDEIKSIVGSRGDLAIDRGALSSKADELDALIERLKCMRDGLRKAANCVAERHVECQGFRKKLKAASTGKIKPAASKLT
ncbi:MAG: helix-turn-helix domain-containing protein [Pseudomonadota bacterium]